MGIGEILGLVLLGTQIIKSILPKKKSEDGGTTQTVTEMPKGYQSPFLGLADLYSMMGGLQRNQAYQGWGWPEGMGPGSNPFGADFMQSLLTVWPDVIESYKQGSNPRVKSSKGMLPPAPTPSGQAPRLK